MWDEAMLTWLSYVLVQTSMTNNRYLKIEEYFLGAAQKTDHFFKNSIAYKYHFGEKSNQAIFWGCEESIFFLYNIFLQKISLGEKLWANWSNFSMIKVYEMILKSVPALTNRVHFCRVLFYLLQEASCNCRLLFL